MNMNIMRRGGSLRVSTPAGVAVDMVSSQGRATAAPAPRSRVLREIGLNMFTSCTGLCHGRLPFSIAGSTAAARRPKGSPNRRTGGHIEGVEKESLNAPGICLLRSSKTTEATPRRSNLSTKADHIASKFCEVYGRLLTGNMSAYLPLYQGCAGADQRKRLRLILHLWRGSCVS